MLQEPLPGDSNYPWDEAIRKYQARLKPEDLRLNHAYVNRSGGLARQIIWVGGSQVVFRPFSFTEDRYGKARQCPLQSLADWASREATAEEYNRMGLEQVTL